MVLQTGTVIFSHQRLLHEILLLIFFIPIDRPDLGDGPLKGVKFVSCACAEQRAFYALICMLNLGTNAQFR